MKAIEDTQTHSKVKVENGLKDCLSCEIWFDETMKKAWIAQSCLIQKLKEMFESETKGKISFGTPGRPGFTIICSSELVEYIDKDKQS